VDSNARSKTWHDAKTNARGRNLEEYLISRHLHIINKELYSPNIFNCIGTSNNVLNITNKKPLAKVREWEISNEDHNYIQFTIREVGAKTQNINHTKEGTRFIIKEEKFHIFDQYLVNEIWKTVHNEQTEGGSEEFDKYLSTKNNRK